MKSSNFRDERGIPFKVVFVSRYWTLLQGRNQLIFSGVGAKWW